METIRYFHQPTISESLGNGWYVLKKHFWWLLLVVIITSIFDGPSAKYTYDSEGSILKAIGAASLLIGFGTLIFLLVRPVVSWGAKRIFLQCARNENPNLSYLFAGFQHNYFNIVLTNLLLTIIIVAGFLFLILPGIFLAIRLVFVPYLVVDKELELMKAIETSWKMTSGYEFTILGMALMSIFIVIIGLICLVVGVFPAIIWINSSFASLYQAVLSKIKENSEVSIEI